MESFASMEWSRGNVSSQQLCGARSAWTKKTKRTKSVFRNFGLNCTWVEVRFRLVPPIWSVSSCKKRIKDAFTVGRANIRRRDLDSWWRGNGWTNDYLSVRGRQPISYWALSFHRFRDEYSESALNHLDCHHKRPSLSTVLHSTAFPCSSVRCNLIKL